MQSQHLPYDQLTPLEQCIADRVARQETTTQQKRATRRNQQRERMDA